MASQVPVDDNSNAKSEEGTMAFYKKRARRVSFAENTSVHIFPRDEDSGTPLDPKPPSSPSDDLGSAERNHEPSRLFWNVDEDDNDNNNEDDDMDEPGSRSPFLRFVGSPSSGGSTVGSANSNDEDNFFGPVSANFIRRDLLDSSASEANHDQTMDSTAFSMHFHSIARSESELELKTSTGVPLSFDEKTPTHDSVTSNTGTPMLMTLAKNQNHQPSLSTSKLSTKSESNDMSIVGEYHLKYDYGELSPTFNELMADPFNLSILKSPRNVESTKENRVNLMDFSCDEDNNLEEIIGDELVNEVPSLEKNGVGTVNGGSTFSPSKKIALGEPPEAMDVEVSKHLSPRSSIMATPTANSMELVKDTFQIKSNLDFSAIGQGNPSPKNTTSTNDVVGKEHKSPFVNSLTGGATVIPSKSPSYVTPSHSYSSVFVRTENQEHVSSIQSMQKSMSKLKVFEASPFSAALNAKIKDSITKSVARPSKMTPLNSIIDSGHLSIATQKKRERESSTNMNDIRLETPNNIVPVTRMENVDEIASPQRCDLSSQKRLKLVNTTRRSPLRVEKSGSLVSSTEEEMVDIREVSLHEVHCDSETKGNSAILLKDKEDENFQSKFMGSDIVIGEMKAASPVLHEETDIQSCKKNLHDQFCQSPSNKQPHNVLQDEDMMVEITARNHTSPKGYIDPEILSENKISTIVQKLKHPNEINTMVSNEIKELVSQSVDKFNLHVIDSLSDILDQLLMSKTYQLLSDEIQSQKSVSSSNILQHKRVSETKLLLCKFVHKKAKLQLMQVKREKLLKRAKSLASAISESEELRSKIPPKISPNAPCESMLVNTKNLQESQIDSDEVTSTRLELNHVDQRIESLTKSFHKSCKMKEELSSFDTITFVNNHLKKQACCQIIRKDMQLWVVDNLKSRNGCHSVDLNYLDLLTQRLTVNAGQLRSVSISHELNDVNISKIFKDMEARTAFRFVFNGGTTQKHVDAINMAKETQVTGARFGNLLDVMEEIQNAKTDLKNLISTRFHTPSAGQLDLELHFYDPKHCRKAAVTFNTSCLGRGIYPSEIIPYRVQIPTDEPQKSSPTLAEGIKAALEGVEMGFLRIQRIVPNSL